jgi:hypothetical protein
MRERHLRRAAQSRARVPQREAGAAHIVCLTRRSRCASPPPLLLLPHTCAHAPRSRPCLLMATHRLADRQHHAHECVGH